ncbi:RIPOR family member 3 isoform X2 [Xenopus laevis]|uniref:RIPOR family member 3 isoform X2 n=1 Tax=Xenopus laevis TaxID=8355 RepID=A0A8J0TZ38_XENLA|nr:RIPOR family member 3 isoform X2 [Xenopus laevis]
MMEAPIIPSIAPACETMVIPVMSVDKRNEDHNFVEERDHSRQEELLATMSVKLRFSSPSDGLGGVGRSRSFAGFSTLQVRKTSQSLRRSSVRSKVSVKSDKLYPSLRKGSIRLDPHPHQVKKIFEALRKGLNEYLEEHQTQLDFLAGQQKDIKRNSRLAYFYDLDKEIRLIERHIRKLEFHISKIEELYETYCIQWRLRVGACNMKQAFSLSPCTKASRESLIELYRNFQECTEDMCTVEGELEVHLGEFLIKMKGLVGYARLCPGDHYEVLIRLGRQRWRLKGKIETDDSQMWDEEERMFIPNLCENFEIKVIELRGLTTIVVGLVTCDSADFFTTRPRIIIVDITELGTIKLQLEVIWNPFNTSKLLSTPGTTTKFSTSSRKTSLYHWTPPNTPSFREKFYVQNDLDSTFSTLDKDIQTPYILSYLVNSTLVPQRRDVGLSHQVTNMDSLRNMEDKSDVKTNVSTVSSREDVPPYLSSQELFREESLLPPSSHTTLDILKETPGSYGALQTMKPTELHFDQETSRESIGDSLNSISFQEETVYTRAERIHCNGNLRNSIGHQLEEVLELLKLEKVTRTKLKEIEQPILNFKERVKDKDASQQNFPMDRLLVETALESFDFLNVDFHADEMSLFGSVRTHSKSMGTLQERAMTIGCNSTATPSEPSTGNEDLDLILSLHLRVCKALLKKLSGPSTARILQNHLLEELRWQKEVLDYLSIIFIQKAGDSVSIDEVIPKAKKIRHLLKLWKSCTSPDCPWLCASETFLCSIKKMFAARIKRKYPGQLETVCRRVLEQMFTFGGIFPAEDLSDGVVSIFLLYGYLRRHRVLDLEKYITALTREVTLIEALPLPGRLRKIKKLKAKQICRLQPLPQLLCILANFQLDENKKLSKASANFLSRASTNKQFKHKAVVYYTEVLSGDDTKLQRSACLALKHLKGTASLDQIACLCQSEVEDVRNIARDTILSFGQKGRQVFGKTDQICRELQETLILDGDIEITVF